MPIGNYPAPYDNGDRPELEYTQRSFELKRRTEKAYRKRANKKSFPSIQSIKTNLDSEADKSKSRRQHAVPENDTI